MFIRLVVLWVIVLCSRGTIKSQSLIREGFTDIREISNNTFWFTKLRVFIFSPPENTGYTVFGMLDSTGIFQTESTTDSVFSTFIPPKSYSQLSIHTQPSPDEEYLFFIQFHRDSMYVTYGTSKPIKP